MVTSDNRRERPRNKVNTTITVVDDATGSQLGKLVNIHQEGLMIISQKNLQEDSLYQATLITQDENLDDISVGLDCMWKRPLEQGNGCWAGFKIIAISEQGLQQIKQLAYRF